MTLIRGVDGWVSRGEGPWTPSGPGGSSGKRLPPGDARQPGPSPRSGGTTGKRNNRGCTTFLCLMKWVIVACLSFISPFR